MNLLQLYAGSKQYGPKILFQDARFSINEGDHVGVIGPNGAGKTTLFKILAGLETLDSGELIKSKKLVIGYLEQEAKEPGNLSAEEYLEESCITPVWELKALGLDLGLSEHHFRSTFQQLSGGYRMRMKLLQLIGRQPNLMLLDEPTNFLDLESILTLEKFLQGYKSAFLLISHDREFLKRTTEHTLEVESPDITKFPGHIDDYFEQKAQLRTILEAQAANQDNKRKSIQDFIDRFGAKATKARQAQSRMKMLDKMEKIDIKDLPVKAPPPIHTGKETLQLTNANLGYGDKTIVANCQVRLERGDHLGVVGFNGVGKSTLLKSLSGRLPLVSGELKLGYQVSLSYYAQHVSEDLLPDDTVIGSLQKMAHPDVKAQEILNLAGSLLFSGDSIQKKIKVLSGGEKSRVAIGQILLKRSPLLLLDEPTNHLDFDTVEALTEALREYPGSLVVVSHDRSFIGRIATKILEVRDGTAEVYPGTYDDYLWSLEKGALRERFKESVTAASSATTSTEKVSSAPQTQKSSNETVSNKKGHKQLQAEKKELQRKLLKSEETLHTKTKRMDELNIEILTAKGPRVNEISKELSDCSEEAQRLEETILNFMEGIEQIDGLLPPT
ncbi:MAG: ABC transporter ATP-binding protein [Bdellovibrio sp. 28-41-41]|nr:MAG: ABC transporter ATP-binding protein [Bdellovibrio sp. 28-41-41]